MQEDIKKDNLYITREFAQAKLYAGIVGTVSIINYNNVGWFCDGDDAAKEHLLGIMEQRGVQRRIPTKLVGVTFANRQELIKDLNEHDELVLIREPGNPYDSNALAVFCKGNQLGFIGKELAAEISPKIDACEKWQVKILNKSEFHGKFGLNVQLSKVI